MADFEEPSDEEKVSFIHTDVVLLLECLCPGNGRCVRNPLRSAPPVFDLLTSPDIVPELTNTWRQ